MVEIGNGGAKMRQCITHHHACDCREEKFAKLEAENKRYRRVLEVIGSQHEDGYNEFYVVKAKQALKEQNDTR